MVIVRTQLLFVYISLSLDAGFFDADLSNCLLEGANLNQANLEMANLR